MKKKSILVFFLILALVILISGCTSTTPTTGTIEVNSTPPGAKIYLDGVDTGMVTPFTIPNVGAGSHVIKLDKFHHKIWEETVIVTANDTKYLNPLLTSAPPLYITLQPDPIVGVDAEVYSAGPSTNYGDSWNSGIGNIGSTITRMYIKFNLSAVPADARIVDADLNLYRYMFGSENFSIGLYRVTDDWDESTITWNLQPDSSTDAEITNNITAGATTWESWWDLDTLVQGWLDGSITNYGMVLKDTNETSVNTFAYFYTSDYTGDATMRPKLEIYYYIP